MGTRVHETAVVDARAELGEGVEVGPHAVIGPEVEIGVDCEIGAGAQIYGPTVIGVENRVFPQATVGFEPQDLKYEHETVRLEVGDRNSFREFCTIHRGTGVGGGVTTIGSDNLFMVYSHVAHDCHIGSSTIFVNNATLAGHVVVGDHATIGAFSAVHQFCRVGQYAYIGGYTVLTLDALPFVKTVGQTPRVYGINHVGLKRKGFSTERIKLLRELYRLLVRNGLNTTQAIEAIREKYPEDPDALAWVEFVETSHRGVARKLPDGDRAGARGA